MTEPKKTGRPPLPNEERKQRRTVFLPAWAWAKVDQAGGVPWLLELVRRARPIRKR